MIPRKNGTGIETAIEINEAELSPEVKHQVCLLTFNKDVKTIQWGERIDFSTYNAKIKDYHMQKHTLL